MAASVVSVSKRLLGELKDYAKEPHECLEELAPVGDNLMKWTAIMKGVQGTAYERTFTLFSAVSHYLFSFVHCSLVTCLFVSS